jgi:hypothetical protein
MTPIEATDLQHAIEARGLRMRFFWRQDRWVHELDIGGEGAWSCLVRTIEGDPDRDDPGRVVSPTYQQFHLTSDGAGTNRALLVGQSGPHHFSAVFTVAEGPGGATVEVDVADRCRSPIEALASSYWIDLPAIRLVDADASTVVWQPDPAREDLLRFEGADSCRVAMAEAGRRAAKVQAEARLAEGTATQRFLYRWRWVTAPNNP